MRNCSNQNTTTVTTVFTHALGTHLLTLIPMNTISCFSNVYPIIAGIAQTPLSSFHLMTFWSCLFETLLVFRERGQPQQTSGGNDSPVIQ